MFPKKLSTTTVNTHALLKYSSFTLHCWPRYETTWPHCRHAQVMSTNTCVTYAILLSLLRGGVAMTSRKQWDGKVMVSWVVLMELLQSSDGCQRSDKICPFTVNWKGKFHERLIVMVGILVCVNMVFILKQVAVLYKPRCLSHYNDATWASWRLKSQESPHKVLVMPQAFTCIGAIMGDDDSLSSEVFDGMKP